MTRGLDLATGLPRSFGEIQIALMRVENYRRALFNTAADISERDLNLVPLLEIRLK